MKVCPMKIGQPGLKHSSPLLTWSAMLNPLDWRLLISPLCAIAAQHAIAIATMKSIFFDAFSLAIRHPLGFSTATVDNACCLNSSLG
jgi:hypothetical protein